MWVDKNGFNVKYGFIISNDNYKKLILDNYFQELFDKNICVLEKTNIT